MRDHFDAGEEEKKGGDRGEPVQQVACVVDREDFPVELLVEIEDVCVIGVIDHDIEKVEAEQKSEKADEKLF